MFPFKIPVVLSSTPSVQTPVAKRWSGPSVRNATSAVASLSVEAGLNGSFSDWAETTLPSSVSINTPWSPYNGRAFSGDGEDAGDGDGDGAGTCAGIAAQYPSVRRIKMMSLFNPYRIEFIITRNHTFRCR